MDWEALPVAIFGKRIVTLVETVTSYGWTMEVATLGLRFRNGSYPPFYVTWTLNPETGKWSFGDSKVIRPITDGSPWPKLAWRDIPVYAKDPRVIMPEPPPPKPKGLEGCWGPYEGR